jgi:dTMP kinase
LTVGRFITLEGSEGVGKTSNVESVCATLDDAGIDYFRTREPGGTELAEALRALLLRDWKEPVAPITELLVVFAARAQHLTNEIRPRLARGQWVVCDRFTDATYAYQGYARELPLELIELLEQWVQGELQPDLTIYLDLDPRVALGRISDRPKDRLEQETDTFFTRVRQGYVDRAKQFARFRTIDADQPLEHVQQHVRKVIEEFVRTQKGLA